MAEWGTIEIEVDPGTHKIRIELEGYEPVEDTVTVSAGEIKELEYTLTPSKAEIEITKIDLPRRLCIINEYTLSVTVKNKSSRRVTVRAELAIPPDAPSGFRLGSATLNAGGTYTFTWRFKASDIMATLKEYATDEPEGYKFNAAIRVYADGEKADEKQFEFYVTGLRITELEIPDTAKVGERVVVRFKVKNYCERGVRGYVNIYLDDRKVDEGAISTVAAGRTKELHTEPGIQITEAGTHTIKVEILTRGATRYYVTDVKTKTISVSAPEKAKIIIKTRPAGAKVYVDGKLVGTTS